MNKSGFSLIEILIVIGMISMLAGLVIMSMVGIRDESNKQTARVFVNSSIKAPMLAFQMRHNRFPTQQEGVNALLKPPPLIDSVPIDPWGNPYCYQFPAQRSKQGFDFYSLGPDGVPSGDDIGNWDAGSATSG